MSINYRLNIAFWGLTLLMGLAIIATFFTVDDQKIHETEINIAGRQRMLTLKMALDVHALLMGDESARESLVKDANSFDKSHNALLDGGYVTLDDEIAELPYNRPFDPVLFEQLNKAGKLWNAFYKNIKVLIDNDSDSLTLAANYIAHNNLTLLEELERTVKLFENHAGEDLSRLKTWQISFLLLAISLSLAALYYLNYTIVRPVNALRDVTSRMADGALNERAPVLYNHEVGRLAMSFNRMAEKLEESYLSLEKKVAEKTDELRSHKEILEEAQRIACLGSWDWNMVDNKLFVSDEFYRIIGLESPDNRGLNQVTLEKIHSDDVETVFEALNKIMNHNESYSIDYHLINTDGTERTVHEEAIVILDEAGHPTRMLRTVQDITTRKKVEYELKKLSEALEQSVSLVLITDLKGNIEYVNSMFEEVTGYSKAEIIGSTIMSLILGNISKEEYKEFRDTISSGKNWRGMYKCKKKNGDSYWVSTLTSPIRNDREEIEHYLTCQEDITEKKVSAERIEHLASYDALTGLINRNRFMELMSEYLLTAQEKKDRGALLFLDIDDFKTINDTLGYNIGDEFLRSISELMRHSLRDVDSQYAKKSGSFIGRLCSDEFAVFLPSMDEKKAYEFAEAVRRQINQLRIDNLSVHVTASIGIVLFPEHGKAMSELFAKADAAVFRAKERGKNTCHLYLPEDRYLEKMHSRLEWKERIQKALKDDRFEAWAQPIMNLKNGEIYHYEALARMRDEDGSIILPGTFIEMAELFGLVGAIDRVITEKTMKLQAKMAANGKHISFGMNLSGKDLESNELLPFLQSKIEETGADPQLLHFEITETAAINDLERAIKFINDLKSIGCKFALDDFGVGFTSFVYLRDMPVDYVKIDGSFIKNLHNNKNDQLFVKAITDVARGMGIKTIAEFVEEKETIGYLKEFGVDYAQGYFISKPVPDLDLYIKERTELLFA